MSKLAKWGGAALVATGAAVLGVGLGGEEVAAAFPDSGVAAGLGEAGAAINSAGASAANAVSLGETISGKAATAIVSGTAAVTGAAMMLSSSDKESEEKKKLATGIQESMDARQREEFELARQQFIRAMREKGDIVDGSLPPPPSSDKGRGQS